MLILEKTDPGYFTGCCQFRGLKGHFLRFYLFIFQNRRLHLCILHHWCLMNSANNLTHSRRQRILDLLIHLIGKLAE